MAINFKAVCAALLIAGPAAAAPSFTVNSVSVVGDDATITAPYAAGATTAGPITLSTDKGTFVAWCIDIYHEIQVGGGQSLGYQFGQPSTNGAPSPQTLSASTLRTIGQLAEYGQSLIGTSGGTNDALAAVQLAIWSTEYAGFSYTGAANAPVSATLAAASSEPSADAGLLALNGTQTFVTATPAAMTFAGAAVPEPAGLALMASAVAGLGVMRRRVK